MPNIILTLRKLQSYFQTCNDSGDYNRTLISLFDKEQILITNKQIEIQNAILLINNYLPYNNKIYLNALISQVKNLFCLQCHKNINQNKLFIPCGCFFCSYNCLIEHFNNLPLLPVTIKGTICVCPDELYEGFYIAKIRKKN